MPQLQPDLKQFLETAYSTYNCAGFIGTDPLVFLHTETGRQNIELTGLTAACLAYGRVCQIQKSVSTVLDRVPLHPDSLAGLTLHQLEKMFSDFRHRFTAGSELASFFFACGRIYKTRGSLKNCFVAHYREHDETCISALTGFVSELKSYYRRSVPVTLLPDPEKKSACKRLHLFLRWMIRKDDVDPGPWSRASAGLSASKLIIPLDTHMHRIAGMLGFTKRKQADMIAALEITRAFGNINPADPVKYDFSLTRMGMLDNAKNFFLD